MSTWAGGPAYLDLLLVLEPPLADDDVLDATSVPKLLLKHGVELEELLGLVLGDPLQGVLVDHPHALKLRQQEEEKEEKHLS